MQHLMKSNLKKNVQQKRYAYNGKAIKNTDSGATNHLTF